MTIDITQPLPFGQGYPHAAILLDILDSLYQHATNRRTQPHFALSDNDFFVQTKPHQTLSCTVESYRKQFIHDATEAGYTADRATDVYGRYFAMIQRCSFFNSDNWAALQAQNRPPIRGEGLRFLDREYQEVKDEMIPLIEQIHRRNNTEQTVMMQPTPRPPFDPKDFSPPHVIDETPIQTSRLVLAKLFAQRFRQAAYEFRNPKGKLSQEHLGYNQFAEYPITLPEDCGKWLIQAYKAGLIPIVQRELIELVDWHTKENPEKPPEMQAMYVRCPYNLFLDLCGGNMVKATPREVNGEIFFVPDERRFGGLMPRLVEGHLDLTRVEQFASTCDYLAALIEESVNEDKRVSTVVEIAIPNLKHTDETARTAPKNKHVSKQRQPTLELISDEITEDEFAILDELVTRRHDADKRRVKAFQIAKQLKRNVRERSFLETMSSLGKRGFLDVKAGRHKSGYFVTTKGKQAHQKYLQVNQRKPLS